MSELDPELVMRYTAAVYRVWKAHNHIVFRVDNENPDLDKLLDAHNTQTAAFITAHNPGSQVLNPADNDLAHKKLLKTLRDRGLCWLAGDGVDPEDKWIPETSVMVLGIDNTSASAIARLFEQNAYVWIQRGEPPHLVLTNTISG